MGSTQIFSIAIGAVVIALSYSFCYQVLRMQSRASAVIAMAFAVITYLYLQENPDVLNSAVERIALALIGAVIAVAIWIRRWNSR
jgi:hypothetical protein